MRTFVYMSGEWIYVPIEETCERHLYLATSARFPSASVNNDDDFDIPLRAGIDIARGTSGEVESGSYSIDLNGTSASPSVQKLLGDYRDKGMV